MQKNINASKAEIWLTDLYHHQHPIKLFPLGIGYIASYIEKVFPDRYLFRLFTDHDVLKYAKRNNVSISMLKDLAEESRKREWFYFTEVILGLPGDSEKAHMNSLRMAVESEMRNIRVYNFYLLVLNLAQMKIAKNFRQIHDLLLLLFCLIFF